MTFADQGLLLHRWHSLIWTRPGLDQTELLSEEWSQGTSPGSMGDMQIGSQDHNKLPGDSAAALAGEVLGQF